MEQGGVQVTRIGSERYLLVAAVVEFLRFKRLVVSLEQTEGQRKRYLGATLVQVMKRRQVHP